MVRVAWCGGYALTGAPASSDVGYEPRHCQQGNHHDDREAIVFEPWTKFALPLWSTANGMYGFFLTVKEPRKLGVALVCVERPACDDNRPGFHLSSGYESRNVLGQSFVIISVRLPFARSVGQSKDRPKLHFHRHDTPAKHPQESQNIPPARIKVSRYASRQSCGGRQFVSPSTRSSQGRAVRACADREDRPPTKETVGLRCSP